MKNKPKYYNISVKYPKGKNYTPADVMRRWAMENYESFYRDKYGKPYIRLYHIPYYYESWNISCNGDIEVVTITLKQIGGN